MSFLASQAIRLLRSKFSTPTLLAQEIYSILLADVDPVLDGPLTINVDGSSPAIVINSRGASSSAIQINKKPSSLTFGDIPAVDYPATSDLGVPDFGYESQTTVNYDGTIDTTSGASDQTLPESTSAGGQGGAGGNVLYGTVVGNNGKAVQVALLSPSPSAPGQDVPAGRTLNASFIQLAEDAVVPVGTGVFVFQVGQDSQKRPVYRAQCPVWLGPPAGV